MEMYFLATFVFSTFLAIDASKLQCSPAVTQIYSNSRTEESQPRLRSIDEGPGQVTQYDLKAFPPKCRYTYTFMECWGEGEMNLLVAVEQKTSDVSSFMVQVGEQLIETVDKSVSYYKKEFFIPAESIAITYSIKDIQSFRYDGNVTTVCCKIEEED